MVRVRWVLSHRKHSAGSVDGGEGTIGHALLHLGGGALHRVRVRVTVTVLRSSGLASVDSLVYLVLNNGYLGVQTQIWS